MVVTIKTSLDEPPPRKIRRVPEYSKVELLLEPAPVNRWEEAVVLVAYSLPKVSARVERLLGTNVIRLTDRKYMVQLRSRIEQDYQCQLAQRNEARMIRELERLQNLILAAKTDIIPDQIADHPIFLENKKTDAIIKLRRTKLKTNREKDAERLLRQGIQYERERLYFEKLEEQHVEEIRERKLEQKLLEEQFREEDAVRGLKLLRIRNKHWRPCELDLKEFIANERSKAKKRDEKKPIRFISDKKDIEYIKREKDRKNLMKKAKLKLKLEEYTMGEYYGENEEEQLPYEEARKTKLPTLGKFLSEAHNFIPQLTIIDSILSMVSPESNSDMIDSEFDSEDMRSQKETESGSRKSDYLKALIESLDRDTLDGMILSKQQYLDIHYLDPKLANLKLAKTMNELYGLAEEIILNIEEDLQLEEDLLEEEGEEELSSMENLK